MTFFLYSIGAVKVFRQKTDDNRLNQLQVERIYNQWYHKTNQRYVHFRALCG